MPHPDINGGSWVLAYCCMHRQCVGGANAGRRSTSATMVEMGVRRAFVPNTHFRPWRPPPSNGRLSFSGFNDVALLNSMLGNVSAPRSRRRGTIAGHHCGGGTMAAIMVRPSPRSCSTYVLYCRLFPHGKTVRRHFRCAVQ